MSVGPVRMMDFSVGEHGKQLEGSELRHALISILEETLWLLESFPGTAGTSRKTRRRLSQRPREPGAQGAPRRLGTVGVGEAVGFRLCFVD